MQPPPHGRHGLKLSNSFTRHLQIIGKGLVLLVFSETRATISLSVAMPIPATFPSSSLSGLLSRPRRFRSHPFILPYSSELDLTRCYKMQWTTKLWLTYWGLFAIRQLVIYRSGPQLPGIYNVVNFCYRSLYIRPRNSGMFRNIWPNAPRVHG